MQTVTTVGYGGLLIGPPLIMKNRTGVIGGIAGGVATEIVHHIAQSLHHPLGLRPEGGLDVRRLSLRRRQEHPRRARAGELLPEEQLDLLRIVDQGLLALPPQRHADVEEPAGRLVSEQDVEQPRPVGEVACSADGMSCRSSTGPLGRRRVSFGSECIG